MLRNLAPPIGLISFAHPEWQPGYDGEMDQAVVTRRRLLDQAAADRVS